MPQGKYINYDEIIKRCEGEGIDVTWRKLNYYKTLGLLPKAERQEKDKRGYYPEFMIFVLAIYHFLQNNVGMTLEEIGKLVTKFKGKTSSNKAYYLFAEWVNATYGKYLPSVLKHVQKREDIKFGAATMGHINWFYKNEFEKTGISFYWKAGDKEKVKEWGQFIEDSSTRWGEQAAGIVAQALQEVRPK